MSRGTSGGSRWSGWPWDPTRQGPRRSLKARRTVSCRAARAVLAVAGFAVLAGCGHKPEQQDYERLVAEYRRGQFAAVAAAAQERARTAGKGSERLGWQYRLLATEALTAMARFAEAESLVTEDPPEALPIERARAWVDRAQLRIARVDEAAALLKKARHQPGNSPEIAIRLDLVEGNLAAYGGHPDRAEQLYRSALAGAERRNDLYYEANALNNISVARRNQNRHEESIGYALRAVTAAERVDALRMAAAAHGSLGTSYAYLGELEAGLEHEQKAIRMNEQMGLRDAAMRAIGELAVMYDRVGRVAEAIPQHERAFQLATELKQPRDAARFAENLAHSLIKARNWDAASEWNDRAWDLAKQSRAESTLPFLLRNRAEIAKDRGRPAEAAAACREILRAYAGKPILSWEAHHLLGLIESDARRYAAANREFEAALADIEASRSDVLDARYRVTLLSRLIEFYRDYVDALVAQGADLKALAVAESSRARVLSERLGRDVEAGRFADAAALRALARSSGASLVSFWIAPRRSFAWLITPAAVRRFDLPPADEIESLVTAYRGVVEHSVADPMEDAAGRALWEKVAAPVARELPAGSRVIIVPDGPLHRLNLETLPAGGPKPHYWIEDVELSVAPSVSLATAARPRGGAPGSLLLIGAPDYTGVAYQALPGAAAEVEELRKRFAKVSPAVVTGRNASPAAYRAASPANYSLIHFAAHAEANSEKPLESAVVLSRAGDSFKLYARDVIDIPIHADLVTLSGCRGAGARAYAGEGLMGFAWAFLRAGARAVVAGLWDVSDGVTAPLMARFYDGVLAQHPPAAALRQAKLGIAADPRYRKPFYWGAFQTYVGGGAL